METTSLFILLCTQCSFKHRAFLCLRKTKTCWWARQTQEEEVLTNNSSSFQSDTHTASRKTTWRSELLISKSVSTDPCLSIQTYWINYWKNARVKLKGNLTYLKHTYKYYWINYGICNCSVLNAGINTNDEEKIFEKCWHV